MVTGIVICQNVYTSNENFRDYQLSSKKYFTDSDGTIMMKVNVWGHVNSPGGHMVYDGIDFASLLSIVGGPLNGADLKKFDFTEKFQIIMDISLIKLTLMIL